ncbi:uncharacterized protein NPIL_378521 [Nephila pilipes]|uniref:Uncharacterized protein n=1 Tax=Nephila pilipes TaxID=299642 RepID=A0A8X6TJE4_NEPPI|nr:uncharacterized protein NPIL_378521 [Nephila pilipes]
MLNFILSLEHLALIKIAVDIYNDPEIRSFENESYSITSMPMEKLEPLVKKKMLNLDIFPRLQKRIIGLMRPISYEITTWLQDHHDVLEIKTLEPSIEFSWQSNGTINRLKTAKNIMRSEDFSVLMRFRMACIYWSEEDARRLWKDLHPSDRSYIPDTYLCEQRPIWDNIMIDWTSYLESDLDDWTQFFHAPLSIYCREGATLQGLLFQHLTPQERMLVFKEVMAESPVYKKRFCLSQMTANEREEIFAKEPFQVLRTFLNWPLQLKFLDVVESIMMQLTKQHFYCLLHEIISEKIKIQWNDYDYVELLQKLWERSPGHFKQYVAQKEFFKFLMKALHHDYSVPFLEECPCYKQ